MSFSGLMLSLKGFFDRYGEDFLLSNDLGEEKNLRGIFLKTKDKYVRKDLGNDCLSLGEAYFVLKKGEEISEGDFLKNSERELFALKSETLLKKGDEMLKKVYVRVIR